MSQNNKPQTWDELMKSRLDDMYPDSHKNPRAFGFVDGVSYAELHLSSHPRVVELLGALEKITKAQIDQNPEAAFKGLIIFAKSALEKFNNGGIE